MHVYIIIYYRNMICQQCLLTYTFLEISSITQQISLHIPFLSLSRPPAHPPHLSHPLSEVTGVVAEGGEDLGDAARAANGPAV